MTASDTIAHARRESISAVYPSGISWDIDIPEIDLPALLDEAVASYPDNSAVDFLGKTMAYRELGALVDRAAKGLQNMGIGPDSKVGLFMPNTPYYPIMFFAALKAGATVVNYNSLFTEEEIANQVKDSGTDLIVTVDLADFQNKLTDLQDQDILDKVVSCSFTDMLPFTKKWGLRTLNKLGIAKGPMKTAFNIASRSGVLSPLTKSASFKDLINNNGIEHPVKNDPQKTAVFQYTGGTTGVPKGAMLSHFNLVANATQIERMFVQSPDKPKNEKLLQPGEDRIMASIPYFHVFGMMVSMIVGLKGGTELVILPNARDIKETLKTIERKQPKLFPVVPRLLQAINEYPKIENYDLSSIDLVISGGAALPEETYKGFERLVGKDNITLQGYGLSETSPVAASNPPSGIIRNETVGLAYPQTEIRIVDAEDPSKTLNIGEDGEICIRGPQVMKGYYNKPEETDNVMTGDGWFKTGDIGHLDDNYYLHIVDRKKRMININGENVYPLQIEKVLAKHPAVAESVVIGIPYKSGEAAKAFIRYKPEIPAGDWPREQEIRNFLADHLNKLEIPKFFEIRDEELPKTSVGKPDFRALELQEQVKQDQPAPKDYKPKP